MLGSLGLLGVIFALVPGFIADLLYRACWGYEKGDEYERTLRAIIWSVLGLVLFGVVWSGAPNYIGVLIPGGKTPVFDWSVAVAFGCHVLFSSVVAWTVGAIAGSGKAHRLFARFFRRSLMQQRPWDVLWSREASGRSVRVVLNNGHVYGGLFMSASTGDDEKELILGDPLVLENGRVLPLQNSRILYLRQDEIREVHLNFTDQERENARRQNEAELARPSGDAQNGSADVGRLSEKREHHPSIADNATAADATISARNAVGRRATGDK
jgi:hypothetical protein